MLSLNPEQQAFYDKVVALDFSKILLLGAGGAGKSVVLCKAISELVRTGNDNVVVCAPTHLARLNILNKMDADVKHMVETCTVASLLLKFGIDKDDGTTQFTSAKVDRANKYRLIALDECSMISDEDYKVLMSSTAKIIFTGDFSQLPPVMAKSAEKSMHAHTGTGNLSVFKLTQQMRQQGVIHAAAERNRKQIWFPEENETGTSGESIRVYESVTSMINSMVGSILSDKNGYKATQNYRYIAYKNDDVRAIGKSVRDRVLDQYFGFNAEAIPFIKSELIMMRENKGSIGYNGEVVEIVSVKRDPKYSSINPYPWDSYELSVTGSLGTGMIRTFPPCQYKYMKDHMEYLQGKLRREQIQKNVGAAKQILDEIKRIRSYWTMTQYPYAVTTHKSQGMTIENVYLNTLSFAKAPNRRALLYVGISRASKTLHTVKVPAKMVLNQAEVNAAYRAARSAYEDISGESYRKVVRYLGVPTGSLEGKEIVTGYLLSLVEDMKQ